MDDLDALLAERAEQGAAMADLASDPVDVGDHDLADLPDDVAADLDTDVPAGNPPAAIAAAATAANTSPVAPAPAPAAAPRETIAPPSLASAEPHPAPASAEPAAAPVHPQADWRAKVVAALDAVNRPFAFIAPSVREILGYAGVALLGAAFFLVLLALMR